MARPHKLTEEQLKTEITELRGWDLHGEKIHKTFKFANFVQAWGFMSRVALVAQAMDHHPEWSNIYSTVQVDLSTHDAGGITMLDIELARKMDAFV